MAKEHLGHRERMRQRFRQNGLKGFAPHEVLELLLFYAIPQRDVNPLAHRLVEHFGSLHGVMNASVEELMQVEGVGECAATLLNLVSQTGKELEASRDHQRTAIKTRADAEAHCFHLLYGLQQEKMYLVCMNGQSVLQGDVLIASGSIGEVTTYPRLVAEAALRYNAHMVILCHNHPGGSLVPSQSDVDLTERLAKVLNGIEVRLVDHIIVAGDRSISMSAYGLIKTENGLIDPQVRAADSSGEVAMRHRLSLVKKGLPE